MVCGLTGSGSQGTVEWGAAESVKERLLGAGIHDMAYAPAGDMFEMGAKVQVLKKRLLVPMRASRLHALYTHYSGLEDIPVQEREKLERSVFRRTFEDIWQECLLYLEKNGRGEEAESAKTSPKVRMARVFKWYFSYATDLSFREHTDDPVNRQIHTGPALGAFNQWVAGTGLESWRSRHVDAIALHLLEATSKHLSEHLSEHLGRVSGRFAATDPQ